MGNKVNKLESMEMLSIWMGPTDYCGIRYGQPIPTARTNIGDINGDAVLDLAFYTSPADARTYKGSIYILNGGRSIGRNSGGVVKTSDLVRIDPGTVDLGLPQNIGDFNGDGIDDLVITTTSSDFITYLIYGGQHLTNGNVIRVPDFNSGEGVEMEVRARKTSGGYPDGYKFASGDVNGDGLSDVFMYTAFDQVPAFLLYGRRQGLQTHIVMEDL